MPNHIIGHICSTYVRRQYISSNFNTTVLNIIIIIRIKYKYNVLRHSLRKSSLMNLEEQSCRVELSPCIVQQVCSAVSWQGQRLVKYVILLAYLPACP